MTDEVFEEIRSRIPRNPITGNVFRAIVIGLLALIFLSTSFYTVDPEEAALVLRFGKYVRTADPGLHFKIPFGVEDALKVPIQRQLKAEFGFRTLSAGVKSQFTTRGFGGESNMLTGDLNAAVVEWVIQYRIIDPYKNVDETLRDMSEAVMRSVVGDRLVNEVLTVGRAEVAMETSDRLQELCGQYETGIKVEQVVLRNVVPPDPVKPSFNEVNQAQQEKARLINVAQSEYNQVIPRAQGEALQTIQEAEGYALDRVNRAQGDAARFDALYAEYRKAPDVTRRRIYLETMNRVLPKVERKIVVDDQIKGILPLLNLPGTPAVKGGDR